MFGKVGVYIIENVKNGKCYIGSTRRCFKRRWSNHLNELRKNKHHSIKLQRSFNKHGESSFKFKVLEYCKLEKNREQEQKWIDRMNPEYNMLLNITDTIPGMLGKKHKDTTKVKMSKSAKGRKKSAKHRKSISLEMKRQWQSGERTQSKVTYNTKVNMGRAKFSGILLVLNKDNKELLNCWSIADASDILGIKKNSIAAVLGGHRNSVYGYKFIKKPLVTNSPRLKSKEDLKEL